MFSSEEIKKCSVNIVYIYFWQNLEFTFSKTIVHNLLETVKILKLYFCVS